MKTVNTIRLVPYSEINSMSTGESKQVIMAAPHAYTTSSNRGYILGYNGSSVVDFTNDSSTAFADFNEIATAAYSAANCSNKSALIWTLTKLSTGFSLTVNGYNPYATSNTTASWSKTQVTWSITQNTQSYSTGGSSSDGVSEGYSSTYIFRLSSNKISGTNYLNQGGSASALKFATGTGGWTPWVFYEVTESTSFDISAAITGGTVSESSTEVVSGSSYTYSFNGDEGGFLKSMTINGASVSPTYIDAYEEDKTDEITMSLSTNYSSYENSVNSMIDGNDNTYWWTSECPSSGKYILITFSSSVTLNSVTVMSTAASDYLRSNNDLQISDDNSNWTTVGTFTDSQTSTVTNVNQTCKYARIYCTSSSNYWLKLYTLTVDFSAEVSIPAHYEYTINPVIQDLSALIKFGFLYAKDSSKVWPKALKAYQKVSGTWTQVKMEEFVASATNSTYKFIKG